MNTFIVLVTAVVLFGAGCTVFSPTNIPNTTNEPAPVAQPASGSTLDLSGRGLTAIPNDVFTRTELVALDLSDNNLTGAPQAEIRQLQNLKVLDLSVNNLTGLPAELGQLRKLETLDVSNNQLTGLPMELGNLTQLRVLDISGNDYSAQDLAQISAKLTNTDIRK